MPAKRRKRKTRRAARRVSAKRQQLPSPTSLGMEPGDNLLFKRADYSVRPKQKGNDQRSRMVANRSWNARATMKPPGASGGTVSAAERTQRVAAAQRSALKRRKAAPAAKPVAAKPVAAKQIDPKKRAVLDKLRKHMDSGKPMKVASDKWDAMVTEAKSNDKWKVTDEDGKAKIELPDGRVLNLERE